METVRGRVVVVGQAARDLVLAGDAVPAAGDSTRITERIERLGGKGANQAVGLRQLGADVALVAVLGDDAVGGQLITEAAADGIETGAVVRRGQTALLVDLVTAGERRLLEHVPEESLLTVDDVLAATPVLQAADTVCLQLQQPGDALVRAARIGWDAGARIVLDGAIDRPAQTELLTLADVVRSDDREAELLTGMAISDVDDALRAADVIMTQGPDIVAFTVPGQGDLVVWPDGQVFLPYADADVVDVTGAGDAFLAGLVAGLRAGDDIAAAAQLAARAAAATVTRLGGRPDLGGLAEPAIENSAESATR